MYYFVGRTHDGSPVMVAGTQDEIIEAARARCPDNWETIARRLGTSGSVETLDRAAFVLGHDLSTWLLCDSEELLDLAVQHNSLASVAKTLLQRELFGNEHVPDEFLEVLRAYDIERIQRWLDAAREAGL